MFQGVAIGFVFVPISTVAFLTIPGRLRTEGTALLTLIRNIFSSIGISVVIAQLTNTTTAMHARLLENVTPFNNAMQAPDVAAMINMATDRGRALMDLIVTQQAVIIAYANDYMLMLILALAIMPFVLMIGSSRAVQQQRPGAGHAMD